MLTIESLWPTLNLFSQWIDEDLLSPDYLNTCISSFNLIDAFLSQFPNHGSQVVKYIKQVFFHMFFVSDTCTWKLFVSTFSHKSLMHSGWTQIKVKSVKLGIHLIWNQ